MPLFLDLVLTLLVSTVASCVAVRYVIPKHNPVIVRLRRLKTYGLVVQPLDYSDGTWREIQSVVGRSGCTVTRIPDDFGNGITYFGISGSSLEYGFRGVRDSLLWSSGLCINAFMTAYGEKYDRKLFVKSGR